MFRRKQGALNRKVGLYKRVISFFVFFEDEEENEEEVN